MTTPQAPIININGSSADRLIAECKNAERALFDATEAVSAMTVHGRDFQTAPDGAYERMVKEHRERLAKLSAVYGEIRSLRVQIHAQAVARRRAAG